MNRRNYTRRIGRKHRQIFNSAHVLGICLLSSFSPSSLCFFWVNKDNSVKSCVFSQARANVSNKLESQWDHYFPKWYKTGFCSFFKLNDEIREHHIETPSLCSFSFYAQYHSVGLISHTTQQPRCPSTITSLLILAHRPVSLRLHVTFISNVFLIYPPWFFILLAGFCVNNNTHRDNKDWATEVFLSLVILKVFLHLCLSFYFRWEIMRNDLEKKGKDRPGITFLV